jgi:TIR domain
MTLPAKPVFISYPRASARPQAEALHTALGHDACFLDTEAIAHYDHFPRRLADTLLGARVVVVLASRAYFQRWYCLREWLLARAPWDASRGEAGPGDTEIRLGHLVVALGDDLAEADLQRLPPPLQRRNLPSVSATAALRRPDSGEVLSTASLGGTEVLQGSAL